MSSASRREFVTALGAAVLPDWPSSFPALRQKVNGQPLVYLDSAATTLRPQAVIDAVAGYYSTDNANPSKAHSLAARAAERLHAARQNTARFVNASHASEVIFVRGTTEGVNLVASSWGSAHLGSGDEIVLSVAEHSSNFMPWARAAERAGANVRLADVDDDGRLSAEAVAAVLSTRTKLVAFSHVSNVLGYVNPAREITAMAKAAGAVVAIDGAQAAPHVRIDVRDLGCDFYIFSGHKMLGPMATGVVWGRQELLDRMPPYHVGSNMAHDATFERATFERGALKFQAGTPDVAGPVGLAAAIAFLERSGHDMVQKHDESLVRQGLERLRRIPRVRLIGPTGADRRLPVFTFTVAGLAPAAVASELDRRGIAVRAGDLAALPLLKRFGVAEAVRASAYVYSTTRDFDRLADALDRITRA
ncbi:MAG TPA: cysteine desulfurase [Vicinamibacterales bacterium]|jgi:cysteine sulfinate desulfinase/cysteine desulfurase/selenocysteine lyase|nr:cysteine desulfurase [Vicinamibacterales bacterium]